MKAIGFSAATGGCSRSFLLTYGVALVGTPYSRFLPVSPPTFYMPGRRRSVCLLAAPGIGAVIAGLGIASLGRLRRTHFVAMSVLRLLVRFDHVFLFALAAVFDVVFILVGASNIAFRAVANSIVQMETPPEYSAAC